MEQENDFDQMLQPILTNHLVKIVIFLDTCGKLSYSSGDTSKMFQIEEGKQIMDALFDSKNDICSELLTICGQKFQIFQKNAQSLQATQSRNGFGLIARDLVAGVLVVLYRPSFMAPNVFNFVESFCSALI
mmetsp:Transcript_12835/g.16860  ORF Transcript_12835/g.16860 Transcript_12835/m.16860 type:complete len:131 (+) Transcript_12835:111-503(+)